MGFVRLVGRWGSAIAAAVAATTTTATVAAAATTTAAVATTATTTRTLLARTGLVHHEVATVEVLAVERRHSGLALGLVSHGHEAEASRATGLPVSGQKDLGHGAISPEELLETVLGRAEVEIADIDLEHVSYLDSLECATNGGRGTGPCEREILLGIGRIPE